MYRLLFAIFIAALLAACSSVDRETHDMYTEIPDISITLDTSGISEKKESQPVFIEIRDGEKTIDGAEIDLEVWRAVEGASTSENYPVSQREDGVYITNIETDVPGLYFAKANISAGDLKAVPTAYFIVGELDSQEHALLEEILPNNEDHESGHH
ncbi:hypothetical protein ACFOU0_01885 [Salinicoccus sesuvii]|uniref:YtkA-like domain-containing protein n=1 Tax=Salinicoccus sesuvii TaxID=868281 RepID=A0ABV7N193_9STAP